MRHGSKNIVSSRPEPEAYPMSGYGATPGEGDFCPCGATFVRRRDGRPGRICAVCDSPELFDIRRFAVQDADGVAVWVDALDIATLLRGLIEERQ